MEDWANLLYAPLYDAFGVSATLTPVSQSAVSVTVIDHTKGVEVSPGADLNTIRPAFDVRVSDLTAQGIQRTELRRAALVANGKNWRVEDYQSKPSPLGEDAGELRLLVIET